MFPGPFHENPAKHERTYSTNRNMNCVIDSDENGKKGGGAHEMAADWGLKGKPGLGR